MKKRMLSALLALCLVLALLPGTVFAANTSGKCGENLTWSLSNGVLTISGTGEMDDFSYPDYAPWYDLREEINTVRIGDGVTSIGVYAFEYCTNLVRVTIPDSVTSIGDYAFELCFSLSDVTIPAGVTYIGKYAFTSCSSLTEVTIPAGVTSIEDFTFCGCGLTAVTIPNGVTSIGIRAFDGCGGLTAVTIPNSVTTIEWGAFSSCYKLTSIIIPDSVTSIGDGAFWGCWNLASVTINGVPSIGINVFYGTPWLESLGDLVIVNGILLMYQGDGGDVVIPDGVTAIVGRAFFECVGLTGVTIPDSVTSIGDGAFEGCTGLTEVTIPGSGVFIGGGAFSTCTGLKSVTVSGSVTSIGTGAFWGCTSLTDVTASGSGVSIGGNAFWGCTALKRVTIFGSVTPIDFERLLTFSGCTALEEFIGFEFERYEAARALLDGWSNPGQYVKAQSERITAQAGQIIAGLTSDYEKAKAISAWVSENILYDFAYIGVSSPEVILDSRRAVCEGYAQLTEALLQAAGIPARYIDGPAYGMFGWDPHAWNMAFVDERWIWIDNTWGMEYFDCGTGFISTEHKPVVFSASAEDTPSSWAQDEVWEAICKGLVPNDLQAKYRDSMTREEFCRLMVSLLEKASGQSIGDYLAAKGLEAKAPFTDTGSADVAAAYALGIVDGVTETSFDPNGTIQRQQAAAMLARTAKVLGLTAGSGESFADEGQFASWAREGIAFASGLTDPVAGVKVMNGVDNGCFAPKGPYNRQQAILTALRLLHCAA